MTTQTVFPGGATSDLSTQHPANDSAQDAMAILAAAQTLRSQEVGKYLGIAARFIRRTLGPVFRAIGEYFSRRHEMTELMRLNDRELADIGLSRGDLFSAQRAHARVVVAANENLPRSVA